MASFASACAAISFPLSVLTVVSGRRAYEIHMSVCWHTAALTLHAMVKQQDTFRSANKKNFINYLSTALLNRESSVFLDSNNTMEYPADQGRKLMNIQIFRWKKMQVFKTFWRCYTPIWITSLSFPDIACFRVLLSSPKRSQLPPKFDKNRM